MGRLLGHVLSMERDMASVLLGVGHVVDVLLADVGL